MFAQSFLSAQKTFDNRSQNLIGYSEDISSPLISNGVLTLDISTGNIFNVAHNQNISSLRIIGASPRACSNFTLSLVQGSGGTFSLAIPASVNWPSATAPTINTTDGYRNVFTFFTFDGGITWLTVYVGYYAK